MEAQSSMFVQLWIIFPSFRVSDLFFQLWKLRATFDDTWGQAVNQILSRSIHLPRFDSPQKCVFDPSNSQVPEVHSVFFPGKISWKPLEKSPKFLENLIKNACHAMNIASPDVFPMPFPQPALLPRGASVGPAVRPRWWRPRWRRPRRFRGAPGWGWDPLDDWMISWCFLWPYHGVFYGDFMVAEWCFNDVLIVDLLVNAVISWDLLVVKWWF